MCWTGPSPFEPQAGLHGQIARERIKFPAEAGVAAAAGMRSLAAKRRAPLDRSSAAVSSRSFATGTCSSFASRYLMNEHRRDEAWRRRRKSAGDGFRRPVVSAGISILAVQDRHHATAANTGCNDFLSRTPDVLRSSSPHVNRQRPVVDPLRQHSAYEPAPRRLAKLPLAPRSCRSASRVPVARRQPAPRLTLSKSVSLKTTFACGSNTKKVSWRE